MLKKTSIIFLIILSIYLVINLTAPCFAAGKLPNPLGITDVPTLIGRIISGAIGIVGSLALLMFIYGGITWMTSGGNEEKIKKGQKIIVWAVFGLVVIFTSYAVLSLLFKILEK